ncbi:DUF2264 domain-containing protein [Rhodobacteraceae bacterium]|nr:DUF2264 domain-containing protein [Paracoccaceae bacterium]
MAIKAAWYFDPTTKALAQANPLYANPLRTRTDLARATTDLIAPLLPHMSQGRARIRLGASGVHYSSPAAEMESFARPLWGLAPLLAGGFDHTHAAGWATGLDHGTDPDHPEYWGEPGAYDQRLVEMAGLSLALLLAPERFWEQLSQTAKTRLAQWLRRINTQPVADNNWLFFRVLVNLALRHVGQDWSEADTRAAMDRLEEFHLEGGYYRDGKWYQLDYYTPMAMHFYGLIVAQVASDLFPDYAARYRARAHDFAQDFQHWFADDGAAVPFGRSLTYRFAQGAFWAACAFANEEVLPWGRIKGLLLRHLRWWSDQPIAERDGVLSVGYSYPNLMMSEGYNAPGSPYWALKSLLVLALPEDHPFWSAHEEPAQNLPGGRVVSDTGGFIMRRSAGDALVLTGGQDGREHRGHDAKYARFAYSSAFAFSMASDAWGDRPERRAVDCGIAISHDGAQWLSRATITRAGIDAGMAWGVWEPCTGIRVDSWLDMGPEGWHVRLHRITTDRPLQLAEGGFSVDRTGDGPHTPPSWIDEATGHANVQTRSALSRIVDLDGTRKGRVIRAAPNTNLRFPRTLLPQLQGNIAPGTAWVGTAVYAAPDPAQAPAPFHLPQTARALLEHHGIDPARWSAHAG